MHLSVKPDQKINIHLSSVTERSHTACVRSFKVVRGRRLQRIGSRTRTLVEDEVNRAGMYAPRFAEVFSSPLLMSEACRSKV